MPTRLIRADYGYFEAVVAGKVREIAITREVGDSVLYHSLIELASVGSIWSEMATQPRESHNVLEVDFWPACLSPWSNFRIVRYPIGAARLADKNVV